MTVFLTAWEVSGRDYGRIPAVHAAELVKRIQNSQEFTLLDVRKKEEIRIEDETLLFSQKSTAAMLFSVAVLSDGHCDDGRWHTGRPSRNRRQS